MKVLVECSIANTGAPAAQIDGSRSREDTAVQVAEIIDRMLCAEARALEPHRGSGEEEER